MDRDGWEPGGTSHADGAASRHHEQEKSESDNDEDEEFCIHDYYRLLF